MNKIEKLHNDADASIRASRSAIISAANQTLKANRMRLVDYSYITGMKQSRTSMFFSSKNNGSTIDAAFENLANLGYVINFERKETKGSKKDLRNAFRYDIKISKKSTDIRSLLFLERENALEESRKLVEVEKREMKKRKGLLIDDINEYLKMSSLKQKEASVLFRVKQPRMSSLSKKQVDSFSFESLLKYLHVLGCEISFISVGSESKKTSNVFFKASTRHSERPVISKVADLVQAQKTITSIKGKINRIKEKMESVGVDKISKKVFERTHDLRIELISAEEVYNELMREDFSSGGVTSKTGLDLLS